ncbi:GspH/FimT family pseudopilin [Rhodoferax mekongensis]|uniref:GspH/FimT family pseudopilin n=1 Tax=Rhodoferax mekongensis TaxID=3068341 RepID=UPI0028BEF9D2|nr:GspH/FimT family pseudopilin [Rhodoferax sp. TBRC 17199]MDT7515796.1 GspH/FimT family pseudopilin [Rhodoferax sp. TBRC 17199]
MSIFPRRFQGFSLIELMITIALAGILLAIAIPNFKSFVAGNRLSTNVNSVLGLINYARSEAIVRNQAVVICPKSNSGIGCASSNLWNEYEIQVFVDSNGDNTRNNGETLLRTISATDTSSNISRITRATGTGVISFNSSGYSQTAQRFDIYEVNSADPDYEFKYGRSICISRPGRARVVSYQTSNCTNF